MIAITYTFSTTPGTQQMIASFERHGYEVANVPTSDSPPVIMKALYDCFKRAATGHEYFIYSDAADTFMQKSADVPTDALLYSTEKACFPHWNWADKFKEGGRWRFLNNGGYCGPMPLIVEFFERYKLYDIGAENGQAAVQLAYLKAKTEGFPIKLDTECKVFQSIAFSEDGEFSMHGQMLYNNITGSEPSIIHGNGLTPMNKIYEAWQ